MADVRSWSKGFIVDLLSLYKSSPCLWKIKSEEYKSKNAKEEAYKKIIDFCRQRGFPDANRDFVVKKIQSLRGSFRKELKKVNDSQRSGKGTDEVYKSSLWYYNLLLFTRDQELPTGSFSNIDEDPEDGSLHDESNPNDDTLFKEEVLIEDGNSENEQEKKVTEIAATTTPTAVPMKRNKRNVMASYQAEFLKVCAASLKMNSKELSEFDVAGINMAKKLAKMDPRQAIYAESIISNVLRRGLLRKLSEHTSVCDNCNRAQTPSSTNSSYYYSDDESTTKSMILSASTSNIQICQRTQNQDAIQICTFYENPP